MGTLLVQIQPDRLSACSEAALEQFRAAVFPICLVSSVSVDEGNHDGRYINVSFETNDLGALWPVVRGTLMKLRLQGASIVTCTGRDGWAAYLLLHHFDSNQPLDRSTEL